MGFPGGSDDKESACNAGDLGFIPGQEDPLEKERVTQLLCGSAGKESAYNVGDMGSIPGLGRSPGEGEGYTLQYSGLENSMSDFHSFHFTSLQYSCLENSMDRA